MTKETKRKRGRPRADTVRLEVRVPTDLRDRVESFAEANFLTFAEAHRELLERGLGDDFEE